MEIYYNNLGANCGERMMYIRSTDVESKNWKSLLMSFPDEALYFMTKGYKIIIIDKSSNKKGKIEKIFCPAFQDFLRFLRKEEPKNKIIKDHVKFAIHAYENDKDIKRKYNFFKNKIRNTEVSGITRVYDKEPSVW